MTIAINKQKENKMNVTELINKLTQICIDNNANPSRVEVEPRIILSETEIEQDIHKDNPHYFEIDKVNKDVCFENGRLQVISLQSKLYE
tara:strand:+ start:2525 stop:2791 length:267 start_codon:yes stop_codon:yes gene_type:complete